jgi:hypothetical protein
MSYILNIIIILLLSLLTLGLLPTVSIANTVPLLPLFFIIALAYFRKGFEPIILAAAMAGIFFDFYSAYQFGFYIIFFILVAVIIRVIYHEGMNSISLASLFNTLWPFYCLLLYNSAGSDWAVGRQYY